MRAQAADVPLPTLVYRRTLSHGKESVTLTLRGKDMDWLDTLRVLAANKMEELGYAVHSQTEKQERDLPVYTQVLRFDFVTHDSLYAGGMRIHGVMAMETERLAPLRPLWTGDWAAAPQPRHLLRCTLRSSPAADLLAQRGEGRFISAAGYRVLVRRAVKAAGLWRVEAVLLEENEAKAEGEEDMDMEHMGGEDTDAARVG